MGKKAKTSRKGTKTKSSRKGKKAWRSNISTEDIHDFFDKSTKDALSGGSLASAPSESLFFVDKTQDLSVKRKIEKHRSKVLRTESVLQKNQFVVPISASIPRKFDKRHKRVPKLDNVTEDCSKDSATTSDVVDDIWGDKGNNDGKKARKMKKRSIIPAVEVDPEGCSYNPSFESHQDALAVAVAEEMHKVYKKELAPAPVPLTVPGEAITEEDMYFLDAGDRSDDDEMDMENEEEAEDADEKRPKTKKVTRVELNKRARRKVQLKKEAELIKVKNLSKEIDSVPNILEEIANDDKEKNDRLIRRNLAKQEKLKTCPPRLGKYKFQPAPTQVMLSEELTGSLRKIKPCSTLAKDRFKSLQKRGLLAPVIRTNRK